MLAARIESIFDFYWQPNLLHQLDYIDPKSLTQLSEENHWKDEMIYFGQPQIEGHFSTIYEVDDGGVFAETMMIEHWANDDGLDVIQV